MGDVAKATALAPADATAIPSSLTKTEGDNTQEVPPPTRASASRPLSPTPKYIHFLAAHDGKPGWKRASTRDWIRDFRESVANLFAYPYKTFFNSFFVTSGYYEDMVSEENYEKYRARYPNKDRKTSTRYSKGEGTGLFGKPSETSTMPPSTAASTPNDQTDLMEKKEFKEAMKMKRTAALLAMHEKLAAYEAAAAETPDTTATVKVQDKDRRVVKQSRKNKVEPATEERLLEAQKSASQSSIVSEKGAT